MMDEFCRSGTGGSAPCTPCSTDGVGIRPRFGAWYRLASTGESGVVNKHEAMLAELPPLRRYARALARDIDAADDLVQDCLERAISRQHQFRDGTDMRAWLFTIMHGIFVNGVRRRPRAAEQPLDAVAGKLASPPHQGQGLVLRDLEAALARLPDEQREIVLLVGLESMSYKQAAEIVGVPLGTVMSRLARGRERLRQLMGGGDTEIFRKAR